MSVRAGVLRPVDSMPVELTPMLGREREGAQLRELLDDPSIRLVTITGPGGVGKTRLALHVAASLEDAFGANLAFVPLAAIRNPALVLPAIAQAFGIVTRPAETPEDAIASRFRDVPALLILDNLEQVSEVAPALADILARCRRVTILATSRVPLNISGEQLFPLAPLPTPATGATTAEIERSDAVQLFLQRARSLDPGAHVDDSNAATLAEICRRLDGLPLAIELAAARTRILSPEALLARLSNRLRVLGGERRDLPGRLRTMRGAIAWSYELLSPAEQVLFRRLSVFAGGFSLDAVEAIAPGGDRDAFDLLGALVDHSLIQSDHVDRERPRFLMLETLRDFGLEQLDAAGETEAALLDHANWAAVLAHLNETAPIDQRAHVWANVLDPERENIRAAAAWSLDHGHPHLAMRIGADLWNFCANRGLNVECRTWLERAFESVDDASQAAYPEARYGAGCLASIAGDGAGAQRHFEISLAHAATTRRPSDEIRALAGLGAVAEARSEFAMAMDFHSRGLAVAVAEGQERNIAMSYGHLGNIAYAQGKLDDARVYYERCRERFAALGHAKLEAVATSNLGAVTLELGDIDAAEPEFQRALTLKREIQSLQDLPDTLINLGRVARERGDHAAGRAYLVEAVTIARENGLRAEEALALTMLAATAVDAGDTAEAASLALESASLSGELDDIAGLLELTDCVAALCMAVERADIAVELLAAATSGRAEIDATPTPLKQGELAAIETSARSALDPSAHDEAWRAGAVLDRGVLARRVAVIARDIAGPQQPAIVSQDVPAPSPVLSYNLTPRETEVLRLLVDGQSTGGIADALYIAPRTAGTHIANVLGKLGVTSRTAAVALALRSGLA